MDGRAWRADIEAAAARIRPHVRVTPVIDLGDGVVHAGAASGPLLQGPSGALGLPGRAWLKLESLQHTGSFKPRGAFNRLLSAAVPSAGVLAASGGNHGAAVAFAARRLGHAAEIFVPEAASQVKVERLRGYGARVTVVGARYADALAASEIRAAETGALVVHAYDQPEVVAGQGTLALEIERQAPEPSTLLVAVGGGGLLAGILAWHAGATRVVAVEPEAAPTLSRALAAGRPVDVEVGGAAVDSLGARRIGALAFELAARHLHRAVLVDDDAIACAQRALWEALRVIAEPGGATALAALLSGAYRPAPGERVGVIVCGGNADLRRFPG